MNKFKITYTVVKLSKVPNQMTVINGGIIYFGARGSNIFIEIASEQKGITIENEDGRRAIKVKYIPAWLSYFILW